MPWSDCHHGVGQRRLDDAFREQVGRARNFVHRLLLGDALVDDDGRSTDHGDHDGDQHHGLHDDPPQRDQRADGARRGRGEDGPSTGRPVALRLGHGLADAVSGAVTVGVPSRRRGPRSRLRSSTASLSSCHGHRSGVQNLYRGRHRRHGSRRAGGASDGATGVACPTAIGVVVAGLRLALGA